MPTVPLPTRLLLASDLSPRSDRALDRAAQLARQWGSDAPAASPASPVELHVLHVADAPQAPDLALAWSRDRSDDVLIERARHQLERDTAGLGVQPQLHVLRGEVAQRLREMAQATHAGLVISGVARDETIGRFVLGSTADRLVRSLAQPLLVVRTRVHGPYARVLVATDFSSAARAALEHAVAWFPETELTLVHARGESEAGTEAECRALMVAAATNAGARKRPNCLVTEGEVEAALARHVRDHDIDLAVFGTHGASGLLDVLVGSTAAKLLDWLPCDCLVVPGRRNG